MAEIGKLFVNIATKLETGGFDNLLKKLTLIGIAGGATTLAFKVLSASIDAASESEISINKLTLAMKNQGIFTEKALKTNLDFSNSLMKITATSDEEINKTMEVLTTYGLHDKKLRETTKVVLDFAKAKGMDLASAANLVGKAFAGETATLQRYGIIIDDNIPKTQRFDAVMGQLNQRFGGTAQNDAKTYAGQMQTFKNNLEELAESIGKSIIPALTKYLEKINILVDAYNNLYGGSVKLTDDIIKQSKYAEQYFALRESFYIAAARQDKEEMKRIKNATDWYYKKIELEQKVADVVIDTNNKKSAAELAAAKALEEAKIKERDKEYKRAFDSDKKTNARMLDTRRKRADDNLKTLEGIQATTTGMSDAFSGYYDYLNVESENRMNKDIDIENASYENKKAWINANITDETEKTKQLDALEIGHAASISNIKTKAEAEERARKKKMKPLLIGEAIANTAVGATKAYQQYGWPWGLAAAALIVAAGAMQVAKIQAQEFAQGGMVLGRTLATIGEAGTEVALPLSHPNTIHALSGALQQAMASAGGGMGGNIYVTVPPISTRQEARRMGEIIGKSIYEKVKLNRKV